MNAADRGMGLGLRALNRIAGLELLDRVGVREPRRAPPLLGLQERLPRRRRRRADVRAAEEARPAGAPGAGRAGRALRPHADGRAADDARGDRRLRRSSRLRPAGARRRRRPARRPRSCSRRRTSSACPMLGVPERARRRVRGALRRDLRARRRGSSRHGDMGLAVAMLAPAAVGTAIGALGRRRPAVHLPAGRSPARARPPPRSRCSSRGRCSTRSSSRPRRASRRATATCSTASSRSCRARRTPSCSSSPRELEGHGPALFIVEAKDDGRRRSRPSPRWACAPPAPARSRCEGVKLGAAERCSPTARPEAYAECVRLGAPRLVRAGRRHFAGRARLRDPVCQRAHRLRRAHLPPPGGRLRRRRTSRSSSRACAWPRYRAASRADQGLGLRARGRARPAALHATKGMQIGSDGVQLLGGHGYTKEHPVERWYRDLRAAGSHGRGAARLMPINLETPEEVQVRSSTQANQVATEVLRPISRKYDRAEHELSRRSSTCSRR